MFANDMLVMFFLTSESYSGFFKLVDYMKHQHPNIKFIFEVEAKTNNFSFLDVKI